jgi:hypothetical protein
MKEVLKKLIQAATGNGLDLDDFLPGTEVVANGYNSVIGYESRIQGGAYLLIFFKKS